MSLLDLLLLPSLVLACVLGPLALSLHEVRRDDSSGPPSDPRGGVTPSPPTPGNGPNGDASAVPLDEVEVEPAARTAEHGTGQRREKVVRGR